VTSTSPSVSATAISVSLSVTVAGIVHVLVDEVQDDETKCAEIANWRAFS
jgi:hypothetical protein